MFIASKGIILNFSNMQGRRTENLSFYKNMKAAEKQRKPLPSLRKRLNLGKRNLYMFLTRRR